MIPRQLAALFPPSVRQRGDAYAAKGAVRIAFATPEMIVALVTGTRGYAVEVHASRGLITVSCTCQYAETHGVCKHGWAVLQHADAEQQLQPLVTTAGPQAQFFMLAAELEGEDADADNYLDPLDFEEPPRLRRDVPAAPSDWKSVLAQARHQMEHERLQAGGSAAPPRPWPRDRRIVYLIDMTTVGRSSGVPIEVRTERLRRDGTWDAPKPMRAPLETWFSAPDLVDRQILQMLLGASSDRRYEQWTMGQETDRAPVRMTGFTLSPATFETTLRLICETERCRVRVTRGRPAEPVRWDSGAPWRFALRVSPDDGGDGGQIVTGVLERDETRLPVAPPLVVHPAGLLVLNGSLARVELGASYPLVAALYERGTLALEPAALPELLESVYELPEVPLIELPEGTSIKESSVAPVPCLRIASEARKYGGPGQWLTLEFLYGTRRIAYGAPDTTIFERQSLTVHRRDMAAEAAALARLTALGARPEYDFRTGEKSLSLPASKALTVMATLAGDGWNVESDGARFRSVTGSRAEVHSGIDWFDFDAAVQYGDDEVSVRTLIDAERQGLPGVSLPDGSIGLLPVELLGRWKSIVAGGSAVGEATRYSRVQASLLDALLETMPDVDVDAAFETARSELRRFDRVAAVDAPPGFSGTLREYQREGLGWLQFLQRFHLGGCLADDMGLGKTVQVLALLEAHRTSGNAKGPSLVVVPRSLVRNWIHEAERFTPSLRVLDHSLADRSASPVFEGADLVITTYGVLRSEAPALAAIEFDYAILDEAQAIKNATTASAKAARLLRARHRLALTGTPIENRLEELWSIFEFLNPGMFGERAAFGRLLNSARTEESAVPLLSRALRPVILRRTKQRVARELPDRTEQTLEVELDAAQRKLYDGILKRYRASVLDRVDRMGISRSRMHILEALLRLRQVACHPALVDPAMRTAPSAKLDALIPSLTEIVAEGHKALVFSQFTSFLSLVRDALDQAGIVYEYLDGKTRNRQARVDRFQRDADCPVFLLSLKAGGQGLNLTAADYVYLLDPWWNPAVEAQAIDRTHRIGQERRVIATRIVARGTVEEKILALQATKRGLADAILSEDQGGLTGIGRAELEALLG